MAKDLSEGFRGQIIALINEGYSQRQVAAKVGVSEGGVQRTVERFRKTQSYSSLPKLEKTKEYHPTRRSVYKINFCAQQKSNCQ